MINEPRPFEGLNIRIPIIILIKGRKFMNQGSGGRAWGLKVMRDVFANPAE